MFWECWKNSHFVDKQRSHKFSLFGFLYSGPRAKIRYRHRFTFALRFKIIRLDMKMRNFIHVNMA